jgi:hypothetical protein
VSSNASKEGYIIAAILMTRTAGRIASADPCNPPLNVDQIGNLIAATIKLNREKRHDQDPWPRRGHCGIVAHFFSFADLNERGDIQWMVVSARKA